MSVLTFRRCAGVALLAGVLGAAGGGIWLYGQEPRTPVFKSRVDLVVLSFTVTDNKGKYVNGLKPSDFKILEDGIKEKLSTFSEGNRPAMQIMDDGSMKPVTPGEADAERTPAGGPVGDFEGVLVMTWDTKEKAYKSYTFGNDFPGAVVENGQWEGDSLVYRGDFSEGTMKYALRNTTKLAAPGKLVSQEYSSTNGGAESLLVTVEATKRP